MDHRSAAPLLALALLGPACGSDLDGDAIDSAITQSLSGSEELGVLAFVNDCPTTEALLDIDAALDVRAARGIAARRDGADASCGSDDDAPFATIDELDAVPYVGDVALGRLLEHAQRLGYVEGDADTVVGTFDGVDFSLDEARVVLAMANSASQEILDLDLALDSRAAAAILDARPFAEATPAANMKELAAASFVGTSALKKMKARAEDWSACDTPATTVKGVEFSSLAAHDSLDMLNMAPNDVLRSLTGIGATIAQRIEFERPFETLDQLAKVDGVGAHVAGKIHDESLTHWCPLPGARCGCPSDASYRAPLVTFDENGLYYLLAYDQWGPERSVTSGFVSHDGNEVVLSDVKVQDDPDEWQQIATTVFYELWDCCLQHQFFGEPLEIGPNRKGTLHLGRVIDAADGETYVMAFWRDIDDASFAWLFEKDGSGHWALKSTQFLN